jgi:peptide/nickel transport system substrate-binding protein
MRLRPLFQSSVVLLCALLAACGRGGEQSAAETGPPTPGGTATVGMLIDFQTLNPVTNTAVNSDEVIKHVLYAPLIQYDEKLTPKPWLAESWQLTDSSVTFTLRDDVKWHDGQPTTAEDVKFTFDLAKDPAAASLLGSAYLGMVKSATVIDPRTIRFDFVAPHAQAIDAFWWAPLPKHLLQGVQAAELLQSPFNRKPVGNGPFRFLEWKASQSIAFEANPDFPAALGGRPYLDRIIFRVIPEATTMVTELLSGSADVIGYTLLPDQAQEIKKADHGLELRSFASREFNFIAWNETRPPFDDAAVRRAMTLAIDRSEVIRGLLLGYAQPASGVIPPWSPMYTELKPLPFDPAQARQVLAQAGWADTNGDGIVEKNGRPLRFTLLVNTSNRLHQDIATVVQQQLHAIGAQVDVRTSEFQTMLREYKARNYDAIIANWTLDTFTVDPTPLFSCAEAKRPNTANRTGYCNPQVDELMQKGLRTTDPAAAKQIWAEFSRMLQQDQPLTFLYWTEDLAGVGPRLRDVEMDVRSKLVNVGKWWIPERYRR